MAIVPPLATAAYKCRLNDTQAGESGTAASSRNSRILTGTKEQASHMAVKEYTWGLGRRKTSVARVRIAPGEGKILVNKRPLSNYMPVERRRAAIERVLEVAEASDRYDVWVNVDGGGETGQSGAIVMGLARALIKAEPESEAKIRPYGFLTRDSRMVERKKYGLRKARRGCQFSKR